jgi:hypothetical protein
VGGIMSEGKNIKRKIHQFVLVVLLFLNFNSLANAQMKWIDEKGGVHYSDTTPSETQKVIKTKKDIKAYSGEKIQIDFYKMDLVNILPILDAMSNKIYVTDSNVGCEVTVKMSAPWDYILDMILEKCMLKMTTNGNIVIIANQ